MVPSHALSAGHRFGRIPRFLRGLLWAQRRRAMRAQRAPPQHPPALYGEITEGEGEHRLLRPHVERQPLNCDDRRASRMADAELRGGLRELDRKSTRLNSS